MPTATTIKTIYGDVTATPRLLDNTPQVIFEFTHLTINNVSYGGTVYYPLDATHYTTSYVSKHGTLHVFNNITASAARKLNAELRSYVPDLLTPDTITRLRQRVIHTNYLSALNAALDALGVLSKHEKRMRDAGMAAHLGMATQIQPTRGGR